MKQSPRLHLERLEDRITPDATGTTLLAAPTTTPTTTDQVVVTTPPTVTSTSTGPTLQQMIDAMNAYLASLNTTTDTGLGTGLGGGSTGN